MHFFKLRVGSDNQEYLKGFKPKIFLRWHCSVVERM